MARIRATSRRRISSWVPSRVTVVMQATAPSGAPASTAAAVITSATRRTERTAAGCGLSTTAHRAFRQTRIL